MAHVVMSAASLNQPALSDDVRRAAVLAAARAAADWARTRRTLWDSAPLVITAPLPAAAAAGVSTVALPSIATPPVTPPVTPPPVALPPVALAPIALPPPAPVAADAPLELDIPEIALDTLVPPLDPEPAVTSHHVSRDRTPIGARILTLLTSISGEARRRLAFAVVVVIVLTAGVSARAYFFKAAVAGVNVANRLVPKPAVSETWRVLPPPAPRAAAATTRTASPAAPGRLDVQSAPSGARVSLDGKERGVTPLTLDDVPAGSHALVLSTDTASIQRTVKVTSNETAQVNELIASGWLSVVAPFDVAISEGTAALQPDDRGQILLAPGPHTVRFVNRELGYDESRKVTVKPGEVQALSLTPPRSRVTITTSEPAEVFIDGAAIGAAPVTARAIDLGTREIVVKNGAGDEKRFVIVATVKPVALDVRF